MMQYSTARVSDGTLDDYLASYAHPLKNGWEIVSVAPSFIAQGGGNVLSWLVLIKLPSPARAGGVS